MGSEETNSFENTLLLQAYAPANFLDSEETRPHETWLDSGSQAPATLYSSVISNTTHIHSKAIRDRHTMPVVYAMAWKRKVRDLFVKGNEAVLGFLTKPLASHPTMGQTEQLIRRYSRLEHVREGNAQMLLKDIVTDLSGENRFDFIESKLANYVGGTTSDFVKQVDVVYAMYREVLEEIVTNDVKLKDKLNVLDKIQPRLKMLLDLDSTSDTQELEDKIEAYLKNVYEQNNPEAEYTKSLSLYKKFLVLKELVGMIRLSSSADREPICGICLNETVMFALVPCGHTFCEACSRRQVICYMCRTQCREKVKIFFT
jgi:hypothetical protein